LKLLGVKHPVLQGVKPWSFRDEMFSRYFLFDNPKRTELLQGTPSNANNGAPRPISWAYERPDGGRSFVLGSVFHDNMHSVEDYRRYLLNAIIWTAKIDVPAESRRTCSTGVVTRHVATTTGEGNRHDSWSAAA
jgi:hypothetical protein